MYVLLTKRGDRWQSSLDDASATIDILCFSEVYHKYRDHLTKIS